MKRKASDSHSPSRKRNKKETENLIVHFLTLLVDNQEKFFETRIKDIRNKLSEEGKQEVTSSTLAHIRTKTGLTLTRRKENNNYIQPPNNIIEFLKEAYKKIGRPVPDKLILMHSLGDTPEKRRDNITKSFKFIMSLINFVD